MNRPNAREVEHWNGPQGQKWAEQQDRYDRQLAPFADAVLAAAKIAPGERVLDIGCGCGTTTMMAARSLGDVVGVDISGPMLDRARDAVAAGAVSNVEFVQADAQTHRFEPASFDVAMSRFGVMFFDDPGAAFANIASALRPDGRIAFVCWQELARNDWMLLPGLAAAQHLPMPETPASGPGPFALADRDALSSMLSSVGFAAVDIEALEIPMLIGGGGSVDDALAFFMSSSGARALFEGADPEAAERGRAAARKVLADHDDGDGVRLGAATWIVTARRTR